MSWIKKTLFHIARLLGGFALAQHVTRRKLRILCYHGFSITDEHLTAPYVFMRAVTFERRMRILKKRRIPVISLQDGVERLTLGTIANDEAVITLDDGWASNLLVMPILHSFNYPACIYITTEHLTARTDAFNVIVGQMVQRSSKPSVLLQDIHPLLDGHYEIAKDQAAVAAALVEHAAKIKPLSERQQLLEPIAEALGFSYPEFVKNRRFQFLTGEEVTALTSAGVSIQLHTHTHNLPADNFEAAAEEILQNQRIVRNLTGQDARHFCYPSGKYSSHHVDWLSKLGIISATTCDPGLNSADTAPLLLKRYLDSENVSDIEFEAEISGLRELLRQARSRLRNLRS